MRPQYDASEHSRYVERLLHAVCQDDCQNVALSGSYGSGKSSILDEFYRRASKEGRHIAEVSLETLVLNGNSCAAMGLKGGEAHGKNCDNNAFPDSSDSMTVMLEREILSQLLYQGNPKKARFSIFNRPHKLGKLERVANSLVLGLALSLIAFLIMFSSDGNSNKVAVWAHYLGAAFDGSKPLRLLILFIFITFFLVSFWALGHLPGGLHVSAVGAAGATLTLDEGESSYFDKYRDELIYLFESNRFDTVIFEDIDRFNDHRIFVELRNLNFVLNHAPGITCRRQRKKICFVYAVKDSLFSSLSGEDDPSVVDGSGRVKLFDQIISVIPFMSKLSSFDQALRLFETELQMIGDIEERRRLEDLLRLIAPQIADMRLMVSIKNDFLVMGEELGCPVSGSKTSTLGLTSTGLLAMAVYKNVYPAEFEKLRLGKGNLDELYGAFVSLKGRWISSYKAASELAATDEAGFSSTSASRKMGELLRGALQEITSGMSYVLIGSDDFNINDNSYEGISSSKFWSKFFSLEPNCKITVSANNYLTSGGALSLTKNDFMRVLSPVFARTGFPGVLNFGDEVLSCEDCEKSIERLRSADFQDMLEFVDYKKGGKRFSQIITEIITDDLARGLITSGFIRSDYDLYISKYPENARANVINFVRHYSQAGLQDVDYSLDEDDCAEVLRYLPESYLARPCCYNADLLCYLLDHELLNDAGEMVQSACANLGSGGKELLDRVFSRLETDSDLAFGLVGLVTESYKGAFDYLADVCARLYDDHGSLEILEYALRWFNPELGYSCNFCRDWIQNNLDKLDFSSIGCGEKLGGAVALFLAKADVDIPSLERMGRDVSSKLIELEHFDLNRNNLSFVSGDNRVSSLDLLCKSCLPAFNLIVSSSVNFSAYVCCLEGAEVALASLDYRTLSFIANSFGSWSDGDSLTDAVESLIERSNINPPVEDINTEILEPLSDYQGFCDALLHALLARDLVAHNLMNAVALARGAMQSMFASATESFAAFMVRDDFEIGVDNELDQDAAQVLVNRLLMEANMPDGDVIRIISELKESHPKYFPIDISAVTEGVMAVGAACLKELCKRDLIISDEYVYKLMASSNWSDRELVLLKWDGGKMRHWSFRFPLIADDIPRVISSRRLAGTWLRKNVIDYWEDYLNRAVDDQKKRFKLEKEIGKRIEKLQN